MSQLNASSSSTAPLAAISRRHRPSRSHASSSLFMTLSRPNVPICLRSANVRMSFKLAGALLVVQSTSVPFLRTRNSSSSPRSLLMQLRKASETSSVCTLVSCSGAKSVWCRSISAQKAPCGPTPRRARLRRHAKSSALASTLGLRGTR